MSEMAMFHQLRRLAYRWRLGRLPVSRLFVQSRQVRFKCCGVRLSLAFGSENGEEVAVYISEVGDPVGWRDLVWFRSE
jgi:hypothetical protein